MKKILIVLACLFSVSAMAEGAGRNYGGIQYGMATYSESGFPDFNPKVLIFRLGHNISKNFAVEGRFGTGISGDTKTISGIPITLEVDSFFGIYAVGTAPLSGKVGVYGLVGFTDVQVTASAPGVSASASENDISYGVGLDIAATKDVSLNVEYVSYINKDNASITSISVGANFAF